MFSNIRFCKVRNEEYWHHVKVPFDVSIKNRNQKLAESWRSFPFAPSALKNLDAVNIFYLISPSVYLRDTRFVSYFPYSRLCLTLLSIIISYNIISLVILTTRLAARNCFETACIK